jgi:hypothetical protein
MLGEKYHHGIKNSNDTTENENIEKPLFTLFEGEVIGTKIQDPNKT